MQYRSPLNGLMRLVLYFVGLVSLVQAGTCPCHDNSKAQEPSTSAPPTVSKRGLAYNDAQFANNFHKPCRRCSWAYNWDWKDNGLSEEIEFVPMLWNENFAPQLQSNVATLRRRGLKYILGFNEPDLATQADMSVERAVDSHVRLLNPYSDVLIGSPAVTSDEAGSSPGSPKSLEWLRLFLDLCGQKGCKIDFCAVHWYGHASEAGNMTSFLDRAHKACPGKKIWLTEFQAEGSSEEVNLFLLNVLPVLDKLDFIQRYAWFKTTTGNLLQSPNTLSETGKTYASP